MQEERAEGVKFCQSIMLVTPVEGKMRGAAVQFFARESSKMKEEEDLGRLSPTVLDYLSCQWDRVGAETGMAP